MDIIKSEWVQAGELGLAFIVIILCASLVMYVMQTSRKREEKILDLHLRTLPIIQAMADNMREMAADLRGMSNELNAITLRLDAIEADVSKTIPPKRRRKTD